jgi:hypothetical protein
MAGNSPADPHRELTLDSEELKFDAPVEAVFEDHLEDLTLTSWHLPAP